MKHLLFNKELFDKGNYSDLFKSVVDSLSRAGVIASPEASMEVYKAIWESGKQTGIDYTPNGETHTVEDYNSMREQWEQLKKEL